MGNGHPPLVYYYYNRQTVCYSPEQSAAACSVSVYSFGPQVGIWDEEFGSTGPERKKLFWILFFCIFFILAVGAGACAQCRSK